MPFYFSLFEQSHLIERFNKHAKGGKNKHLFNSKEIPD
jgi:hypothetical protein